MSLTRSYRQQEAFRLARTLLVDACTATEGAARVPPVSALGTAAASAAVHVAEGCVALSDAESLRHLRASLAATGRLAAQIRDCVRQGVLPPARAAGLLELQEATAHELARAILELEANAAPS